MQLPNLGLSEPEQERLVMAYVEGHGSITEAQATDLLAWANNVRVNAALLGAVLNFPVKITEFDRESDLLTIALREGH
jgi:hypothetical protein